MKNLETFLQPDGTYRYSIKAPDWVVDREDRPHYEKDRFASMEANLKKGDVLFDVGSELGWQAAIYAQFVDPENMCLFEPHAEFWPVIRETWQLNKYAAPRVAYCGFVNHFSDEDGQVVRGWPPQSEIPLADVLSSWRDILTNSFGGKLALDDLVQVTGVAPSAVTIDVEGAEMRVLGGMETILREHRPLVWLSVHPRERLFAFGAFKADIFDFFDWASYGHEYLGVDHEEHYFFYPLERAKDVVLVDSPWGTYGKRDKTFEEAIPEWTDDQGMPYTAAWAK